MAVDSIRGRAPRGIPERGPRQLTLDLPHVESRGRADFLEGPANRAALALIDAFPDWPAPVVALVGPAGTGKSHLAGIFADQTGADIAPARDLLAEGGVPDMLAGGALALEDLDAAAPLRPADEVALFHLLNLAKEQDARVLVTSRLPPARLAEAVATADLASRLRAMPAVTLDPPGEALLGAIALKLFADRQIAPDEGLVTFLLARVERSVAALADLVAALDREALARGRPVTRALAAELLRAREGDDEDEAPGTEPD
ncbi:P-loop NTPase family protein [Ancylobacter terrae]|uniref:chromosomal replication initiator DnaA n=1 Tax=Ancylobacter sp. sgz301288 TaxID=3342077 RepID=UPI003858E885